MADLSEVVRLRTDSDTVTIRLADGSEVELSGDGMLSKYPNHIESKADYRVNLYTLTEEETS